MKLKLLACAFALTAIPAIALAQAAAPTRGLVVEGDHFTLNGKPFKVLSGELHYARIPREYWHARLKMARAMGLNTIATYVFWDLHEPRPGMYDFTGQNDLKAFIQAAQEEGLYVILRAGPYVCAEWDLGGLPSWLLADPKSAAALRSDDPAFLTPVARWIGRLNQEVGSLQVGHGGPILITQVENEYGGFGADHKYMSDMRDIFVKAGFNASMLDTVDGFNDLAKGEIPGVFAGTNFGIGNHQKGMDAAAAFRPGAPIFVTEYWPGWFDSWGHPHQTRPTAPQLEDVDYILSHGAGINLYMFHGGTSFGFNSGADSNRGNYLPDTTSYDYGAPLDESGRPTPKFYEMRKIFAKYGCPMSDGTSSDVGIQSCLPPVPVVAPPITLSAITLNESAALFNNLPKSIASPTPLSLEAFGQDHGYILYRTQIAAAIAGDLTLAEVHDYAQVYVDGHLVGTLDRRTKKSSLPLNITGPVELDILVEATARINYGKAIRTEQQGITQSVTLAGKPLTGWQIYPLPMTTLPNKFGMSISLASPSDKPLSPNSSYPLENDLTKLIPGVSDSSAPAFLHATFPVTTPGDTFLDTRALGKGVVWINGHNLGRFWNIGPQATLYVPGPWLHAGQNEITVLDLLPTGKTPQVSGLDHPILDAPVTDQTGNRKQE